MLLVPFVEVPGVMFASSLLLRDVVESVQSIVKKWSFNK